MASGDAASVGPLPAIAGFRVERALGAGAHGTVYLAQEEGVVYTCEQGRVYASVDGGESWSPTPAHVSPEVATGKLRVAPSDAKVLYVIATLEKGPPYRDAIVRSDDGGASWKTVRSTSGVLESIGDLAISPVSPETAYAWVHSLSPDAGGVAYGASGVFKTEDGGATWRNTFRADPDAEAR